MANKKDLATGLIGTALTTSATTLVLQSGYGAGMPAVPFFLTLTPAGQLSTMGNSEVVQVTARSTDTLTITRAQKGTTARAFSVGDVVANAVYADEVPDIIRVNDGVTQLLGATKIEIGWAAVTFGGAGSANTFTVSYKNTYATRPIVLLTYGGDSTSTAHVYGNGGNTIHGAVTSKALVGPTSFTGIIHQATGSNWPPGSTVYIQYMVIGD